MKKEINRKKLIDYIRKNKPFYRGACFDEHSDQQLLNIKTTIKNSWQTKTGEVDGRRYRAVPSPGEVDRRVSNSAHPPGEVDR